MQSKCLILILNIVTPIILSQYSLFFNIKPRISNPIFIPLRLANNIVKNSRNHLLPLRTYNVPVITPVTNRYRVNYSAKIVPKVVPVKFRNAPVPRTPTRKSSEPPKESDYLKDLCLNYKKVIDVFQRRLYLISFETLVKNNGQENGVSFVQSGVLVYLNALALSLTKGTKSKYKCSYKENISIINYLSKYLPVSNENLKFYWTSRLVLASHIKNTTEFLNNFNYLQFVQLNSTANAKDTLNEIMTTDSLGTLRNTFDEEDFSESLQMALLSSIYFRSQWRVSPTLLNNSLPFIVTATNGSKLIDTKAIRINDVMGYAHLEEWDAEAIEIQYATKGLSFLTIIPRGTSLKDVVIHIGREGLNNVTKKLQEKRIAVSMPVYTLRMTLLLPEKFRAIGFPEILKDRTSNSRGEDKIKLSHGVQGVMFWSEAGRNAYKEDGLVWDKKPELELLINRPYAFFIRWNGITILSGNFVY